MLVQELKTLAVEQDIDSETGQQDADDAHRRDEDEESDRATEPTPVPPLLNEEEPVAWKVKSDHGDGIDSDTGQLREEADETGLEEELKTRVCSLYQTFAEVERDVYSGTDQQQPTASEHKVQDEPVPPVLAKEAGWQMNVPGEQNLAESENCSQEKKGARPKTGLCL